MAGLSFEEVRQLAPYHASNNRLLAVRDGQVIGILRLDHRPDGEILIRRIEVFSEARRQGVATALFREATRRYGPLTHTEQTPDGAAWVASLTRRNGRTRYRRRG